MCFLHQCLEEQNAPGRFLGLGEDEKGSGESRFLVDPLMINLCTAKSKDDVPCLFNHYSGDPVLELDDRNVQGLVWVEKTDLA